MTRSWAAVDEPRIRVFFAALPDAATRERLIAAAGSLRLESAARWVPPENTHLTLAFVGAVPATQLATLRQIGRVLLSGEFTLRFDAYDYWATSAAVVTLARTIPDALDRLRRELCRNLAPYRSELEREHFRPHITLARKVSQAPVLQAMPPFDWTVREWCLMRSDTGGAQSAYTVVDTWSLLYTRAET